MSVSMITTRRYVFYTLHTETARIEYSYTFGTINVLLCIHIYCLYDNNSRRLLLFLSPSDTIEDYLFMIGYESYELYHHRWLVS